MAIRTESGLTKAFTGVNSLLNTTTQAATIADKLMRDRAQTEYFYAQSQLNKDYSDFISSLSKRNDYENFMPDAENWLNEQNKKLLGNCKNNYQGELYKKLMTETRNSVLTNVQSYSQQKQFNDMNAMDQSSINLNNETMSGQSAIDANTGILASQYAQGRVDAANYRASTLKSAASSITKDVYNYGQSIMNDIFNRPEGGDYSEVKKALQDWLYNSEYNVKLLASSYANEEGLNKALETGEGYINIGDEIDKQEILSNVDKQLNAQWNALEKEKQEKHFSDITEMYSNLWTMEPTEQVSYAQKALRYIDSLTGKNLSSTQRTQAVNLFKPFAEGKASGNSGSSGNTKALENLFKVNKESFIQQYLAGNYSAYEAEAAFYNACLEEYEKFTGKKTSINELAKEFPDLYGFLDESQKAAPDWLKGIIKNEEKALTELIKENKLENGEELVSDHLTLLWDILNSFKLKDQKAIEERIGILRTERNAIAGKKLDLVRKNQKTGNLDFQEGAWGNEKKLAEALELMEQNPDMVYTDRYGNTRTSLFANGSEGIERLDNAQLNQLAKVLGRNVDELKKVTTVEFEKDGKDDVTALRIFNVEGNQYRMRGSNGKLTIQKKNKNGEWEKVNTVSEQKAEEKTQAKQNTKQNVEKSKNEIKSEKDRVRAMVQKKVNPQNVEGMTETVYDLLDKTKNASTEKERESARKAIINLGYSELLNSI